MSNVKISGLTAYTNPAVSDVLPIVDLLNDQTKKITISDLLKNGFGPGTVALPSFSFIGDPDTGIYSPGANQFAVTTGGTQRLLIDASGNTTIQGDLTVNGTTTTVSSNTLSIKDKNIEIAVVSTPTDTTADGGGITLKGATDKTLTWVDSTDCWTFNQGLNLTAGTAGAPALVFNGDVNSGLFQPGADSLAIATAGAQRVTVDSSGRVGIGTSSPQRALVVSDAGTEGFEFYPGSSSGNNTVNHYNRSTAAFVNINTTADQHIFGRADGEKMRIDSSGRVGIGTSSAQYLLHIKGGSGTSYRNLAWFQGTGTHATAGFDRAVALGASNNGAHVDGWNGTTGSRGGSYLLLQSAGGNVGIGTTSPNAKLHVNGNLNVVNSGATLAEFSNPGVATVYLGISGQSTNYYDANTQIFRAGNSSSERMRIDSSGRLLVGTSSAYDISGGSGYTPRFQVVGGNAEQSSMLVANTDGSSYLALANLGGGSIVSTNEQLGAINFKGFDGNSYPDFASIRAFVDGVPGDQDAPGRLVFFTTADGASSPTERLRIDSSGNVGIGTSSPARLLHVNSGVIDCVAKFESSDSAATINFVDSGDASGVSIGAVNGNMTFRSGLSTERMRIDSSGKVGIGTASPELKLSVLSDDYPAVHIVRNNTLFAAGIRMENNSGRGGVINSISDTDGGGFRFYGYTSNVQTERLRIDSSGNVGIGTSSPNARLMVNAGITQTFGSAPLAIFGSGFAAGYYSTIGFGPKSSTYTIPPAGIGYTPTSQTDGGKGDLVFGTRGVTTNSAPTERMRISSDGLMFISHNTSNNKVFRPESSSTSYSSDVIQVNCARSGSSTYNLFKALSSNLSDVEFKLAGNGIGYSDGGWTTPASDYAEFFEWVDGNPNNEDRRGISVVLDGNKIREAIAGEEPLGIVSARPSIVGDAATDHWKEKHLTDEFGSYIMEPHNVVTWKDEDGKEHNYEDWNMPADVVVPDNAVVAAADEKGITFEHRKLNPDYDPSQAYISRADRPEWDTVGLLGKLRMRKGQITSARWIKMRDINDSVEEWLVR